MHGLSHCQLLSIIDLGRSQILEPATHRLETTAALAASQTAGSLAAAVLLQALQPMQVQPQLQHPHQPRSARSIPLHWCHLTPGPCITNDASLSLSLTEDASSGMM